MERRIVLSRKFLVSTTESKQPEEYQISISEPYETDRDAFAGVMAACDIDYGPTGCVTTHDVPGFDKFEALENAIHFARFFMLSLAKTGKVIVANDCMTIGASPSDFSLQLQQSYDSVLRGQQSGAGPTG